MIRRWRNQSIWLRGEDAAARLMKREGCRVIARNLRLPMGEIDLLCCEKKSGTIIVVEVKAREHTPGPGRRFDPASNITHAKLTKLRLLVRALKKQDAYRSAPIQIDVVTVVFEPGRRSPVEMKSYRSAIGG